MSSDRLVRLELMRENFGADDDLIHELAENFLAGLPEMLLAIEASIKSSDAKGLDRSAHTFKSTVAIFGAAPLVGAAQELEDCGRLDDMDSVSVTYVLLTKLTERLVTEIHELILK